MGKNANTWYGAAGGSWGGGGCGEYSSFGSLFELTYVKPTKKVAGGWTETSIYQFDGSGGAWPYNELIKDKSGNLYGMTMAGGTTSSVEGVVFEFQP
jgi:hypothetical protein